MTEVRWNRGVEYEVVLDGRCDAPPTAVYDVLTDLSTHLEWAGERQFRSFRLISIDGTGHLAPGATFTSVGSIPMTSSRWEDRSEVVGARAPEALAFVTDSVVRWRMGRRTEARWEHRYEIRPDGPGSRVVYRLRRTVSVNPPLRMRAPVMRALTHRLMIPRFCRRGFTNLLRSAELASAKGTVSAA